MSAEVRERQGPSSVDGHRKVDGDGDDKDGDDLLRVEMSNSPRFTTSTPCAWRMLSPPTKVSFSPMTHRLMP